MGNVCCSSSGKNVDGVEVRENADRNSRTTLSNQSDTEIQDLDRIRRSLHENIELFLFNNILMSMQFFENYEIDIEKLRQQCFDENDLPPHRMKCFKADTLHELVASNVRFQPKHGPNKKKVQLLHPLRTYVIYENVEAQYRHVGFSIGRPKSTPYYRMVVGDCDVEARLQSGYVNLIESESYEEEEEEEIYEEIRSRDEQTANANSPPTTTKVRRRDSASPLDTGENVLRSALRRLSAREKGSGPRMSKFQHLRPELIRKSLLQVPIPPDSGYGYTTLRELTQPHPLVDVRFCNIPESSSLLPRFCFQQIQVKKFRDKRRAGLVSDRHSNAFISYNLLDSAKFRGHFCDVFVERLSEPLEFDVNSLNEATLQGPFINCNKNKEQHQICPGLGLASWPPCADAFMKPRTVNGEEGWPTIEMQNSVQEMGCTLTPLGYIQRKDKNPEYEQEWRIECPKAEKFLKLHLMHSQVRCYLFALLMHKSFLEIEKEELSFGPHHLINHLFWEVRKNFYAWPEDRPGDTLYLFLTSLYKKIQREKLRDFFLKNRNLFESSSPRILHRVQAHLKRVIENPVAHALIAYQSLKCKPGFYPALDCTTLFKIVTAKNIKQYVYPELVSRPTRKTKKQETIEDFDEHRQFQRELKRQQESQKAAEKLLEERKVSVESIKREERPILNERPLLGGEKADELEVIEHSSLRRQEILKFFIPHFVKMAKKSKEYRAIEQALMYLLHARRLTTLLAEEHIDRSITRSYLDEIEKLVARYEEFKDSSNGVKDCNEKEVPIYEQKLPDVPSSDSPSTEVEIVTPPSSPPPKTTADHIPTQPEIEHINNPVNNDEENDINAAVAEQLDDEGTVYEPSNNSDELDEEEDTKL